jgi:RNA polymerase sigma factor (sigma-70 family)
MKNNTLNDKIETALKDDNIVKIMNDASKRFRNQLDVDSIYTCQINALWKSFVNFKPEKQTKFTTYLYNGVFIECLKEVKFQNKLKQRSSPLHHNIAKNANENLIFDAMDELKSDEEQSLFLDRISNMTIAEIAKKHNSNRETVRKKIKNISNKLKKNFN